jgi:hypothetical protein
LVPSSPPPGSFNRQIGRVIQYIVSRMDAMLDRDFFVKSDKIFTDLFDLANGELGSKGFNIEPSVIIDRIISPLKDLYVMNLAGLLESVLEKKP